MKMNRGQAEEIKNSSAWGYLKAEIEYRIDCSLQELRVCSQDKLFDVQKRIQVLDEILQMPDVVIDRETDSKIGGLNG
jgi:hypothetical protein